jgi:hypothetical protein
VTALKVKPSLNPTGSAPAVATLAAAMVEITATPSAAPSSWKVLTMPEVMPARLCSTVASAVVVAATKVAPSPAAATAERLVAFGAVERIRDDRQRGG